jgi:hypothetical protein
LAVPGERFQFYYLSIPGSWFGLICCIGIPEEAWDLNDWRNDRFNELLALGMEPEKAKEITDREINVRMGRVE